MTTIKLKNGSGAPLAGDLVQGEPALDLTNKRLYTENSGGTVIEVGTNPTSLTTGTFTSTGIDDNAASTAMTLDASGNVLVGTTSTIPFLSNSATGAGITSTGTVMAGATAEAALLNRIGSDGSIANFYKAGALVGSIGTVGGFTLIGSGDTGVLFDATEDAIKPRNTSTASRDAAIDLGGSGDRFKDLYLSGGVISGSAVSTYKNTFAFDGASINGIAVNNTTGSGTPAHIAFFHNGTGVGSITCTASATAYNTSSDYRLKENVTSMTGATTRLKQLAPKRFNFIADADVTVDGFLAHEVADVVPEAITGTKDGMRDEEYEVTPAVYEDVVIPAVLDEEGNEVEAERTEQQLVSEAVMGTRSVPDYQGIDQSKLVPLLVATIQELEARIAALESN